VRAIKQKRDKLAKYVVYVCVVYTAQDYEQLRRKASPIFCAVSHIRDKRGTGCSSNDERQVCNLSFAAWTRDGGEGGGGSLHPSA